ncbi:sensor histidine kinase [Paenibacillus pinihumi]|uniref:sensor histidine kinase n=1 Tax=Paenibacillus pinihumi TaxID=669462 RepID=UPI00041CE195|nr:sensor histidine kinase [Paenibacillus pinihumi]
MMERISACLRNLNLHTKLLLLFLVLILLPLGMQGVVTYRHFSQTIDRKTEQFTIDIVRQVNANLNRMLKDLERLSLLPLYDQMVLNILGKYDAPMGSAAWALSDDYLKMKLYTSGQAYDRPEIRGIHLISNSGILFSNVDSLAIEAVWDSRRDPWFKELSASDGQWLLIPPHEPSYYTGQNAEPYISVARAIRDPGTLRRLGYILIDIKLEAFRQLISNLNFEQYASLMIVDSQQRLLFEQASAAGLSAYDKLFKNGRLQQFENNQRVVLDGKDYLYVQHYSGYSGLSVVSLTPIAIIQKESGEIMTFTFWFAVVCMLVVTVLAAILSYRITHPLIKLKQNMVRVEQGDFSQRVASFSNDEFGQLSRGFNRMMEEIDRLFNEVFILGIREKEAELSALQSQINPHFIYNTLESVNMMAVRQKHAEVSVMVTALGKLLRYTIDKVDRLVPLQEEVAFVESYVRIQQVRYGGKLQVIYEIDENVTTCQIPKLILQPLVENAVYHGLDGREEGGMIWILAMRFGDELLLTVRDNGRGLNDGEIEALNKSIHEQPSYQSLKSNDGDKLGLNNIYQRIRFIYGEAGSLIVDGSPGQGLAVTISIRIQDMGDDRHV